MNIIELVTSPNFMMAALAAISVAVVVFTFGAQFNDKTAMRDRIKRVALERERRKSVV